MDIKKTTVLFKRLAQVCNAAKDLFFSASPVTNKMYYRYKFCKKDGMKIGLFIMLITCASCSGESEKMYNKNVLVDSVTKKDTIIQDTTRLTTALQSAKKDGIIETGYTTPEEVVNFAKSLIGVQYKYASDDPLNGFDCSGFISYVFNHFNIEVPRTSVAFTNVGTEVPLDAAKPGDLILFTGTDSTIRVVGHMGIIAEKRDNTLHFIHSTSGRAYGVTITPLNRYYMGRFVKIVSIF